MGRNLFSVKQNVLTKMVRGFGSFFSGLFFILIFAFIGSTLAALLAKWFMYVLNW